MFINFVTLASLLQLENVSEQRIELSKKWAAKWKKTKFTNYFKITDVLYNTRNSKKYVEPRWKSNIYGVSAMPFLIRGLNAEHC